MAGLFDALESQYGLPSGLLDSVWSAESSRGRNLRDSSAGAKGHFQFMDPTARQYGVTDPNDLTQSATGAAKMFSDLLRQTGGDIEKALAGYNWGIGNVQRKGMERAPSETRNYIQKVTASMGNTAPSAAGGAADPWADIEAKFAAPQATKAKTEATDPWAELEARYGPPSAPAEPPKASDKIALKNTGDTPISDAGNAIGTGYFRGLARFAGLPADTAANVLDLGKAGAGTLYGELSGKAPPEWLMPKDRAEVPLTGDWLLKQIRKSEPGRFMVDPKNPEYEGGYLQALGGAASGTVRSAPVAPQLALSGASTVTGKAVGDITGNPALGITASMIPGGVAHYGPELAKATALGANPFSASQIAAKRAEVGQRIHDLKEAGVDAPTLGLATGNQLLGGAENLLHYTPGAIGIMKKSRDAAIAGMQGKAQEAADTASAGRPTGRTEAGRAISEGIGSFRDDFKARQRDLYENRLAPLVPNDAPVNMQGTLDTLSRLNARTPGFERTTTGLKNPALLQLEADLRADLAAQAPPAPGGHSTIFNAPPPQPLVPWAASKGLRTQIGESMADNPLDATVPRKMLAPVYGAMSADMRAGAQAAGGAPGLQAFNRANDYTRAGIERLKQVEKFEAHPEKGGKTPEAVFDAYTALAGNKGSVSTLQAVKKALPDDARGQAAGTIIERLGRAKPGKQDETGDVWSNETFLTNYGNMTAKAREELFSGFANSAAVKRQVDAVAKGAAMMRENSKMWANPSGTGANLAARGTIGGTALTAGGALLGMNPWAIPLLGAGTLVGSNLAARALTSQGLLRSLQRKNYLDGAGLLAPQTGALVGGGLLSRDYE